MTFQLIGSSNAIVGFADGAAILRDGGTALDAVVATIRRVEANPDDHSVGFSGLPNLLGEVELDASIMDGRTLATGAVAAMRGYQDAIDAARVVMETLPHVLIAGKGAEMLAAESGFAQSDLLTPEARAIWSERIDETDAFAAAMRDRAARLSRDPERPLDAHGTVNVIARDRAGNIASGVSTSGWAWKYPGRVGDSPIIGAGNYADQRFGAACCTGRGEMAQRLCTAHSVVTFMRCGLSLPEALRRAAEDLHALEDPFWGEVNIVAMNRDGQHAAASTVAGKTYVAIDDSMSEPAELPRDYVPAAS
ncbi:MAG: N(4)-(beta-N-acetylglucosaminyl)-L-asparaginase [Thermomicrobiales bacterium]